MTHASYNRCPQRRYRAAHHTLFHSDKKFFVREHEIKKGKLMEQLALFYTITTTTCRARNRTVSITGRWSLWRRYTPMACADVISSFRPNLFLTKTKEATMKAQFTTHAVILRHARWGGLALIAALMMAVMPRIRSL